MATVQLRGVSKSYCGGSQQREPVAGEHLAVKQVDLDVRDGEFVVLVGPSGCGKTTTLRMIAGLEDVSGGEISIGDRVVNHVPPKDRNIAMVFQNYALYPHMNVYRNMAFGLELRYGSDWWSRLWLAVTQPKLAAEMSDKRRGIPQRVQQTAEMLGIQNLLQRKPAELSGGEKQRVALGRAIVRQPAAFLFDEPLSNLDAQLRTDMRREIKRLHSELKATMIYVTHDQIEAMTLGDRVVVMNKGEVRQIGTPLEVYDKPADMFVAQFVGSPPMNLIAGELRTTDQGWMFTSQTTDMRGLEQTLRASDLVEGAKIMLGVRAEDIRIAPVNDQRKHLERTFVIDGVESLGDATVIHAHAGNGDTHTAITAKVRERISMVRGDRVDCEFDRTRLHWFNATTGKRLEAL